MSTSRLRLALLGLALTALAGCGGDDPAAPGGGSGAGGSGAGGGGAGGAGGSGGGAPEVALVHRVGRFDDTDPARPVSSWSGTSLRTRLEGSDLSVRLDGAAGVFFEILIDGASAGRFETTGGEAAYPLATGLAAGQHDVEIYRRNEGFFGDVAFLGFEPGGAAQLVPSPSPTSYKIEFIGDSITCGYGVEGPDEFCNFSGDTESAYITYAAIAARALHASAHLIAYSGKGVHQNYGGDMTEPMPELYNRTLTNDPSSTWDFSRYVPDAVVVNLGTNDFSAPIDGDAFVADYVSLLGAVRAHYPSAAIFCVTWAHWGAGNQGHVTTAISAFGDPGVHEVELTIEPQEGFGCDYHPSAATHARLGAELAQQIAATLGL
ncbi:MAG: hypothetical protein IT372_40675 [Polyangiaceae bacterium]|nr:hypothetical protein [Polyangiaceae bacterium]